MKKNYFINLKNENLLAFAGLWDERIDTSSGEMVRSSTIITTQANELVKPIYPERMPLFWIATPKNGRFLMILVSKNFSIYYNLSIPERCKPNPFQVLLFSLVQSNLLLFRKE
ncbi:SOS response-associated peptidase family protein [Adhaeribacter pallidiroseus]|uniref:SOS response-associated peptidase family protein n=1 Tax=Adhaeribacter pallidiroseus TaxID=2072847 RepID=UPI000E1BD9EC|nr:SOS response-associated peptidase family protein [Adhaeribacter pallidiroseus]